MTSTAPWPLRTHTPFRPWRFTKHTLAAVSVSVLALAALSPIAHAAPGQQNPTGVPKNVIFMIGDGMGFNTLDLYNLHYRNSTGYQVSRGGAKAHNKPQPGFQRWPHVAQSTYAAIGSYNTHVNWSSVVGANGVHRLGRSGNGDGIRPQDVPRRSGYGCSPAPRRKPY